MKIRKSLDKIVAVAGGCLVFGSGGGTLAAGATLASSGASLLSAWLEDRAKHGPESKRVLAQLRQKVRVEFDSAGKLSQADEALLDGADYALGEILLGCIPPPQQLVEAFAAEEGFVKTAAAMIMARVVESDDLFAQSGPRADPLARRFAFIVIEAALETALSNRDYFAGLMPFVLEDLSRNLGAIRRAQADHGTVLRNLQQSSARVEALLAALDETPTGKRARREIGDSRPFVVLARRINQEVDDPDQALEELKALVELVLRQQAEVERGTNLGDLVDGALRRVAARSRHGEFDAAAREAAGAFADWEGRERSRRDAEHQAGLRLIEANIEQNMLRRDAEAVAFWIERKIALPNSPKPVDPDALLAVRQLREPYAHGVTNLDLEVAVAIARRALLRCTASDQRARVRNNLGIALLFLGLRDGMSVRLEEAVTVHRSDLKERRRAQDPSDWAASQNNLGNALQALGSQTGSVARLKEAVAAYRAALEECPREREPFVWATTHSNLGTALYALGERECGTKHLKEAIAAHRAALEVQTREQVPLEWAQTQLNLGAALQVMGVRESGTARFEEAVEIYCAILEEFRRDQNLLDWAATQHNLGTALCALGERVGGMEQLEAAVAAYRAALEVYTRERNPLNWANTLSHLGNALRALGERDAGLAWLEEAMACYHGALEEQTRERVPLRWAGTTLNLAFATALVAERTREMGAVAAVEISAREARALIVEARHQPDMQWADRVVDELDRIRRELRVDG